VDKAGLKKQKSVLYLLLFIQWNSNLICYTGRSGQGPDQDPPTGAIVNEHSSKLVWDCTRDNVVRGGSQDWVNVLDGHRYNQKL